jgi:hypothetical protein
MISPAKAIAEKTGAYETGVGDERRFQAMLINKEQ